MKRNIYLTLLESMLLCAFFLTACSKNEDNDSSGEPTTKLVKSIAFGENAEDKWDNISITYQYDGDNKIKSFLFYFKSREDGEEETQEWAIEYSTNKIVLHYTSDPSESQEFLLTALGYVKSSINIDGYDFLYNEDGFLQQINDGNEAWKKYKWEDGNITRITDGDSDDSFTRITYTSTKNNTNIDLSIAGMALMENDSSVFFLRILDLLGKNNKNLIQSATYYYEGEEEEKLTFNYTFDKEGYPVKCDIKGGGETGAMTITYID